MTNKFCVVGSPISHSLSPLLHRSAYKHLGLDFSYEAHDVRAGDLDVFLSGSDFTGVSVTMPLKSEALNLSSHPSNEALLTGASNTLLRTSSGWSALNTDIYGLTQALGSVPTPASTAIIGAGATSRSALAAVAELFPTTNVTVMARDEEAVSASVAFGRSLGLKVLGAQVSSDLLISSDLVLSLVPVGSFEDVWSEVAQSNIDRDGWLFDAAYNPWPTLPAHSWGNPSVISGLEMLIWQAIEQVALFASGTGKEIKLDRSEIYSVMKAAVSDK